MHHSFFEKKTDGKTAIRCAREPKKGKGVFLVVPPLI
jgi:hypothetical protein